VGQCDKEKNIMRIRERKESEIRKMGKDCKNDE